MAITRKEFIKRACLSGAGFCGFGVRAGDGGSRRQASGPTEAEARERKFIRNWISTLLFRIDETTDPDESRRILKPCAEAHYDLLGMDQLLSPYVGDMDKFLVFLSREWDWKIESRPEAGLIIADENKDHCVCPLVDREKGVRSSILCYCSEGFAERMFSKVAEHPVKARVMTSILRGDDRCRYEINLKALPSAG